MYALVAPGYVALHDISVTEMPVPAPGPDQVLIRVTAAALNPLDIALITGTMREVMPVTHPFVVGMDAAGTVAAVGSGVTDYAVGDEVLAYTHFHPGTLAEYTLATVGPALTHRPAGLDPISAAALPAVGLTADRILAATGPIGANHTVAVIGATGGVGSLTVQLAARTGAHVIATATPDHADRMRSFGASEIIDHAATDPAESLARHHPAGVDVVIDLVNRGPELTPSASALTDSGRLLSTLMGPERFDNGVIPHYIRMTPEPGRLAWLCRQLDSDALTLTVAATYPLQDAVRAVADFARGPHGRGKIVITAGD